MNGISEKRTAVLAAGEFPRPGGLARRLLENAKRVVCCDSAADNFWREFGREPDAVVGDCDSVCRTYANLVKVSEQDTNDLSKAIAYCRSSGWGDLVVLGAVGMRDDHALGNIFRALHEQVPVVTEYGVFYPVDGRAQFSAAPGAGVSVFAPCRETVMTSRGLEWPLDGVGFDNLFLATLNRTPTGRFSVESDRPVFIYIEECHVDSER
jgi:thiamine pyrophosphokinase